MPTRARRHPILVALGCLVLAWAGLLAALYPLNRPLFDVLTLRGTLLHRECQATVLADGKPLDNVLCFLKDDPRGEETVFLLFPAEPEARPGNEGGRLGLRILPKRRTSGWTSGGPRYFRHLYANVWAVAAEGKRFKPFDLFDPAQVPHAHPNSIELDFPWRAGFRKLEVRFD